MSNALEQLVELAETLEVKVQTKEAAAAGGQAETPSALDQAAKMIPNDPPTTVKDLRESPAYKAWQAQYTEAVVETAVITRVLDMVAPLLTSLIGRL